MITVAVFERKRGLINRHLMEVTPLGSIVILLSIVFSIWRPLLLFPLSIAASIFVAAAVVNIQSSSYPIGLQPYYFVNIIIFLRFLILKEFRVNFFKRNSKFFSLFLKLLFAFISYSSISILFSILFAGLPVIGSRTGIDEIAHGGFDSLQFSFSSIALIVYLFSNFFYIHIAFRIIERLANNEERLNFLKSLFTAYFISGLLVIVFGIYQYLSTISGVPSLENFIHSSIAVGSESELQKFQNMSRIESTFIEPSAAGSFLGAFSIFSFIYYNFTKSKFSGLMFFLSCFTLLLTTSTTGFLSFFAIAGIIFISRLILIITTGKLRKTTLANFLLIIIALSILCASYYLVPTVQLIFNEFIFNKSSSTSFENRTATNQHSIELFFRTFGLGVGLAGHRPSGLLFLIISNLGVIGLVLFLTLFIYFPIIFMKKQAYKSFNSEDKKALRNFDILKQTSFWGYATFLFSMIIANPTLQDASLWINFSLLLTAQFCISLFELENSFKNS